MTSTKQKVIGCKLLEKVKTEGNGAGLVVNHQPATQMGKPQSECPLIDIFGMSAEGALGDRNAMRRSQRHQHLNTALTHVAVNNQA